MCVKVRNAGENALAQAGSLVPVVAGNAALSWRSADALASTCVPVLTFAAGCLNIALAFAVVGIPVMGFRASLLKAVAAAGVDVPVVSFIALVSKASALTVLSVFGNKPVLTDRALSSLAFPSAGAGVPELA